MATGGFMPDPSDKPAPDLDITTKTYTLRVNGKTLNTINGKKIRNLIYNGTTYEIAEPTSTGHTLTMNIVDSAGNSYLFDIKYKINNNETYEYITAKDISTTITLNNVMSITFEDDWTSGFVPEIGSAVIIGSTSGGTEYGILGIGGGDSITINLTQDTTIYVEGAAIGKQPPDIPMP